MPERGGIPWNKLSRDEYALPEIEKCPKCGNEMEKTQVFNSYKDFIDDDGPYHWEWRCKCGHEGRQEGMKCPKCGSALPLEEGWDSMVYHCKKCHIVIDAGTGEACEIVCLERLYECGHAVEKARFAHIEGISYSEAKMP